MLILYVFIDCKVKGIYFITCSASWDCLVRQSISIDVLYNREANISPEDKDVDVTIAMDDHTLYLTMYVYQCLCVSYQKTNNLKFRN